MVKKELMKLRSINRCYAVLEKKYYRSQNLFWDYRIIFDINFILDTVFEIIVHLLTRKTPMNSAVTGIIDKNERAFTGEFY